MQFLLWLRRCVDKVAQNFAKNNIFILKIIIKDAQHSTVFIGMLQMLD
jgi:hypothetical protein